VSAKTAPPKKPARAAKKSAASGVDSRCTWAADSLMWDYHDREWGVPVHDDRRHFEFLILEGAQAGLSWSTVLRKREGYRRAFADFDPEKVARFTKAQVEKILLDPAIIRNRLKVESAVKNAKAYLKLQDERGSFDAYIWEFVGGKPIVNRWKAMKQIPPRTKESDALSKDLKKRGFTFVGSTIMYAHMQACGLVNDHTVQCWRWEDLRGVK
jgi:DNA-3-methyladenine glycosylase I